MKKVALVTYNRLLQLNSSDQLLIEPFRKQGYQPIIVRWDDKNVCWEDFDLVILRSCWDYHYRISQFLEWLDKLESLKVNLWNPVRIIKWNIDKKYLFELEKKGVSIVPTFLINKKNVQNIKSLLEIKGWEEIIIKPSVGASSYKIKRINTEKIYPDSPEITNILIHSDVIIQPFMEEIINKGEYSFIFIDKKFSHAIHKFPKKGEFRSQFEYGSKEVLYESKLQYIKETQKILEIIDSSLLYARIDGLIIDHQFYLMELELIEPYLYFKFEQMSAQKFVEATCSMIDKV